MRQLRAYAGGVRMNGPKHSFEVDEEYANQIILGNISDNPHYYDSLGDDKDEYIQCFATTSSKMETLAEHVIGWVCRFAG